MHCGRKRGYFASAEWKHYKLTCFQNGRILETRPLIYHEEDPGDEVADLRDSLLRRGLHEVSSEGKVSAQGVMGRAK